MSLGFAVTIVAAVLLTIGGMYIGSTLGAARTKRQEEAMIQKQREQIKKESERRKKANEQKESMETGNGRTDFDNSLTVLQQLRNSKKGSK